MPESAHWYAMLGRAEYMIQDSLPEEVEYYLVNLFFRQDKEALVVFDGQHAFFTNDSEESDYAKLQRLGDKCLLLCGFFPEFSQMYRVAMEDWLDMGANAYRRLILLADEDEESLFQFLSNNFSSVAELLAQMQQISSHSIKKIRKNNHRSKNVTGFNHKPLFGNQKHSSRQLN